MAETFIRRDYGRYRVEYSTKPDMERLQQDWQKLEAQHRPTFFLSWNWISCWLQTYQPQVLLVSAYLAETPVAMGLFVESCEVRHKIVRSKQLLLHQTGHHRLDQIWIEYNGFICNPEHRLDATNACLNVLNQNPEWDEIVLSMVRDSIASEITVDGANIRQPLCMPRYAVDLESTRNSGTDFQASLSGNTRYQIRKSIKLLESEHGKLTANIATSLEEALTCFDGAGKFHVERWRDSGYHNPAFLEFHRNLIKSCFDDGGVELIRVKAGDTTVAILYNLLLSNRVYFYLQGVNYDINANARPGLVAQSLVIEGYRQQGKELYDLMGGYSQYKKQLAQPADNLCTIVIQKPKLLFQLENLLRRAKGFSLSQETG